jgi:hypothetical protein
MKNISSSTPARVNRIGNDLTVKGKFLGKGDYPTNVNHYANKKMHVRGNV